VCVVGGGGLPQAQLAKAGSSSGARDGWSQWRVQGTGLAVGWTSWREVCLDCVHRWADVARDSAGLSRATVPKVNSAYLVKFKHWDVPCSISLYLFVYI